MQVPYNALDLWIRVRLPRGGFRCGLPTSAERGSYRPKERLRDHWSIPRLPEEEWPREQMPAEIARLLARRSARLRERDPKD